METWKKAAKCTKSILNERKSAQDADCRNVEQAEKAQDDPKAGEGDQGLLKEGDLSVKGESSQKEGDQSLNMALDLTKERGTNVDDAVPPKEEDQTANV